MGIIRRMDPHLANMIAAGEVVERPANVVKELLENAIDAAATKISVELKGGGLESIRVVDDGVGMDEEDLALAFERHATSKIQSERDLFRISSLGFRGEALPSIASVSTVTAQSCKPGAVGHQLSIVGGVIRSKGIAPSRQGTSVTVTKLFHNTPARLKYIKSSNTELSVIADTIEKAALAHPEIAFSLEHDEKNMLNTTGSGNPLEAVLSVYGNAVAKSMIAFENNNRDYRIRGYLSSPMHTKSHRGAITTIVNGRVVRHYKIMTALTEAYGQTIPKGRYPIAVLWIEADPSILDVNIHPTKQEIKFSEEDRLLVLIRQTAEAAVSATPYIALIPSKERSFQGLQTSIMETPPSDSVYVPEEKRVETPLPTVPEAKQPVPFDSDKIPPLSFVGQYAGTYLLFQNPEGLFLIDQHAAAERIRYERYLAQMGKQNDERQAMLVPMTFQFPLEESLKLMERLNDLNAFGVNVDVREDRVFEVESIPAWLPDELRHDALEELFRQAIDGEVLNSSKTVDRLAILLSCKHSLKANHFVSSTEALRLVADLNRCEHPYTCPHGRPILVKIALSDVERWFKRIV